VARPGSRRWNRMMGSELDQSLSAAEKERVGADEQRTHSFPGEGREVRINVMLSSGVQDDTPLP